VQISSIYPLAIIHVLGNVLTNVSLGKVAVSFTHTVKASGHMGGGSVGGWTCGWGRVFWDEEAGVKA